MTNRVGTRPFDHRLSPPGVAILLLTVLALGLRLFTLTRTGFLTGVAEYDDGVIEVGVLGRQVRQEQVPRHIAQRRGDALVADPAGLQDLGDEAFPQPG